MKPINCNPKIKEITFIKKKSSLLSVEIMKDNVEAKDGMPKIKKNLIMNLRSKYKQIKKPQMHEDLRLNSKKNQFWLNINLLQLFALCK